FSCGPLVSAIAQVDFGARLGAFVSRLEILFPGNGDCRPQRFGSKRPDVVIKGTIAPSRILFRCTAGAVVADLYVLNGMSETITFLSASVTPASFRTDTKAS